MYALKIAHRFWFYHQLSFYLLSCNIMNSLLFCRQNNNLYNYTAIKQLKYVLMVYQYHSKLYKKMGVTSAATD